jgi:hypothetical protein
LQLASSELYYRSKTKDAKLYKQLSIILDEFVSLPRLKDIAHGMDTNANESISNTISYFAPKNRVYCANFSLTSRVAMAVGVTTLGFQPYFERLLQTLGIDITPNVHHFLSFLHKRQQYRIQKALKTTTKKNRMKRKFEILKEEEQKAIQARQKRDGTYKSGGNIMSPNGFDGFDERKPAARTQKVCPHCGLKGHVTTRSKKCLKHKDNTNNIEAEQTQPTTTTSTNFATAVNPADDVNAYDSMPFDTDIPDLPGNNVEDEFHDCGTWSEDDEGMIIHTGLI